MSQLGLGLTGCGPILQTHIIQKLFKLSTPLITRPELASDLDSSLVARFMRAIEYEQRQDGVSEEFESFEEEETLERVQACVRRLSGCVEYPKRGVYADSESVGGGCVGGVEAGQS
jgi:ATP-dependent RNA circularization protein (DNA/RNA ligase family)